jgi:REP element-mobilizing transposase RayT
VILRGNARQDIFFDDEDRYRFYQLLQEVTERYGYRIHAFCLMTNHVHLAIQVGDVPLSRGMQNLSFRYTRWANWRQGRSGHLFQGRYKALLVDADEYLLALVRYIHLNPLRCGLVTNPSEYRWSSQRAYCGLEILPWLTVEPTLATFGENIKLARSKFEKFVMEGVAEGHCPEFHGASGSDSRLLGDDVFVESILAQAEQRKDTKVSAAQLLAAVCTVYNLAEGAISSGSRLASEARSMSAWIASETVGCTITEIAKATARDPSSLSSAVKRIEARASKEIQLRQLRERIIKLIA